MPAGANNVGAEMFQILKLNVSEDSLVESAFIAIPTARTESMCSPGRRARKGVYQKFPVPLGSFVTFAIPFTTPSIVTSTLVLLEVTPVIIGSPVENACPF